MLTLQDSTPIDMILSVARINAEIAIYSPHLLITELPEAKKDRLALLQSLVTNHLGNLGEWGALPDWRPIHALSETTLREEIEKRKWAHLGNKNELCNELERLNRMDLGLRDKSNHVSLQSALTRASLSTNGSSVNLERVESTKRKRDEGPSPYNSLTFVPLHESNATELRSTIDTLAHARARTGIGAVSESVPASALTVCRKALVKSPAAARAALKKDRTSINQALSNILKIVGSYTDEVPKNLHT